MIYTAGTLGHEKTQRKESADYLRGNMKYSKFTLAVEIARYLNISCVLATKILRESVDGIKTIFESVNKYNQVIYDFIIPAVFSALFEITSERKSEDKEIILLREPREAGYYEFSARDDLVVKRDEFSQEQAAKSFHADTYCFDSKPEKKFFEHYIASDSVKEIYFTGMFTSDQGDLSVYYYDIEYRVYTEQDITSGNIFV